MTKWNKLSRKLPKINTYIYTMNKELTEIA